MWPCSMLVGQHVALIDQACDIVTLTVARFSFRDANLSEARGQETPRDTSKINDQLQGLTTYYY